MSENPEQYLRLTCAYAWGMIPPFLPVVPTTHAVDQHLAHVHKRRRDKLEALRDELRPWGWSLRWDQGIRRRPYPTGTPGWQLHGLAKIRRAKVYERGTLPDVCRYVLKRAGIGA